MKLNKKLMWHNKTFDKKALSTFSLSPLSLLLSCDLIFYTDVKLNWKVKSLVLWCSLQVQFSSVTHSCLTLCNPMDCSTPGFPVLHQLLKLTQTHVHWVSDAVQWSHPLSSPSPPAFNLSQHQSLFQWVHYSHQVAKY